MILKKVYFVNFCQNVRKISISFKIIEKSKFQSLFTKNLDFSQKFKANINIIYIFEKARILSRLLKIAILVKLSQNVDIGQNFE